MADIGIDALMADVVATVATVTGSAGTMKKVDYPPPEIGPADGPRAYCDYGPSAIDQGNLEIALHTITVTVVTPRNANYPAEYALVLEYGLAVQRRFRTNLMLANEAVLTAGATLGKPYAGVYGEQKVVACEVQFVAETVVETVNLLAP